MCFVLRLALLLALTGAFSPLPAQDSPDREAVLAVVKRLFDGMRRGDSAMVRSAFHPKAVLATAVNRLGQVAVEFDTVDSLVRAVGGPHDSIWNERTRNEIVHQDGTLAMVWTEYSFYVGSRFNHCGVDALQLAREGEKWLIIALIDTRRRHPCPEQPT